ncbi:MAG: glyoxalase [Tyzzerella sp.]|nr:glyoxalase [Tyzzerella sp.]
MYEYDEECLKVFLKKQGQLFDEPVAETIEEAEAFLEDCMAVVVDSLEEVREYFEENGSDISDMSDEELEEASEVFSLPNGQYLIVEG